MSFPNTLIENHLDKLLKSQKNIVYVLDIYWLISLLEFCIGEKYRLMNTFQNIYLFIGVMIC